MATILRSSKYVRNFAELATKLGFSHIKADFRVGLLSQRNLAPSTFSKSLATQVAAKQSENESDLEIFLRRLDNDVKRYGRISRKKLERILNAFQSSKSVTSNQALMVIRCCGNLVPDELPESRSELVTQVWKSLQNSGIQLDLSHYNALLRVYIENEYAFSPTEVLAELERKGIEPNKLTYQRLINRYCQQGDIEGASRILEFMREKGLSVNENIFTALVRGHSEANDMVSAADILSVMRQAGLEPSADTYKELLCGYAKRGDIESISSTLSECAEKSVHLLHSDYLDIIFSLASSGHGAHVEAILSVMPKEVGYVQEALNHVLKLVHVGQVDVATQVLLSIPKRDKGMTGASIIKQLAQADLPVSKILDWCKEITSKGIHSRALLIGLEVNLLRGNVEGSLAFLQTLEQFGLEVREHYFWPIFIALGRSRDGAGITNLLRRMQVEHRLVVSGETLREYALPYKVGEPDEILAELLSTGLSPGAVASAITYTLITQMKIREAANFVTQYTFRYNAATFCRPLVTALAKTRDVESFVAILGHIYRNRFNVTTIRNRTVAVDDAIIEPYIIDVATYIKDDNFEILTKVLEAVLAAGYGISETSLARMQKIVGDQSTPSLTRLFNRFKSRRANFVPSPAIDLASHHAEIAKLEESSNRFSNNEEIAVKTKKRLLFLYSRIRHLPNLEKLVTELKGQGVEFTDTMYKQLLDAYINSDVLDKTEECFTQLRQIDPNYILDNTKLMKYIYLLVKNNRIDDAVHLVEAQQNIKQADSSRDRNFWWKLLNTVADLGEPKAVNALFDLLSKNEWIDISGPNLGPLIKVHIVRNDLKEAVSTFEKICEMYQHTPLKNELTKKLIQAEDATALQRLTDFSTQVHGESNSLYDLALSFIESDCLRQAKKILEIPALHSRFYRLKVASERYSEQGMTIYLERLIAVIKDIPYFKVMPEFYENLLRCYDNENNWEKALNLEKQMVEEELEPSHVFFATLGNLLRRNNQPVPFTVPHANVVFEREPPQVPRPVRSRSTRQQDDSKNDHLHTDPPNQILNRTREESEVIESLVHSGKLHTAFEIAEALAQRNLYPYHRTFRFLIRRAGAAGEIELLEKLAKSLPVSVKKSVDLENNICRAYIAAGKAEEYLDFLEKNVKISDDSDPNKVLSEFPSVGIRELLQKQPHLTEKFTKFAEEQAAHGNITPINALWLHHFLHEQPEADKIWSEYLVKEPKVMFHAILRIAEKNNDALLLRRLIETFNTGALVGEKSKASVYSEMIKLSYLNSNYQESIDILQEALKVVPIHSLRQRMLQEMESRLATQGLALPVDVYSKTKEETQEKTQATEVSGKLTT